MNGPETRPAAAGGPTPGILLDLTSVEAVAAGRHEPPVAGASLDWPCPGCGQRRPIADGWDVTVRNRTGPAYVRQVILCAACAGCLGLDG